MDEPAASIGSKVDAVVGDGHQEDEQQRTQNITVTEGIETIGAGSPTSRSVENELLDEEVVRKDGQNLITPTVGQTFESEEQAYEMYNTYAGKVGFSIRKSKTKHRRDGSLCQKFIVCSNQGFRENEKSQKDVTRTGCDARVQFSISKEGIWRVQKVVEQHNHYLASPNKAHKLRSQRQVIEADRKLIGQIREAGMKPAQVYEFMKEFYGGEENIPFSKMDCDNEIGRERRQCLEANDAQTLSEYLRNKQLQDPTFFYAFQVDKEDGRIANFFWADGQSIMDYKKAGKKKKGGQNKGEDLENNIVEIRDEHADPNQLTVSLMGDDQNASFVQAAIAAPYIPGGYTRLLMGDDQNAVRKLHFDGVQEK